MQSTGELLYYKSSKEYEILHIVHLATAHSIQPVYYNRKHPNCLCIVVTGQQQQQQPGSGSPVQTANNTASNNDVVPSVTNPSADETMFRMYLIDALTPEDVDIWHAALRSVAFNLFPSCLDLALFHSQLVQVEAKSPGRFKNVAQDGLFNLEELERGWWAEAFRLAFPGLKVPIVTMQASLDSVSPSAGIFNANDLVGNAGSMLKPSKLSDILEHEDEEMADGDEDSDSGEDDDDNLVSPKLDSLASPQVSFVLNGAGNGKSIPLSQSPPIPVSASLQPTSGAAGGNLINSAVAQVLAQTQQQQVAVISSMLLKRTDNHTDWDERWFVLRGMKLMWYKDQSEYQLANMIPVESILDIIPYFERRTTKDQPRIKRIIKAIKKDTHEKMVNIESVQKLMNDFADKLAAPETGSLTSDKILFIKTEIWSEFLLANGNVVYAMELVMLKKNMVLATSDPELFERWMVELYKCFLLAHSNL